MKKIEEKLLKRIEELIKEGESLKDKDPYWIDKEFFFKWKSNVENLIKLAAGEDSVYYKNLTEGVMFHSVESVKVGLGILIALKEDLEKGFIFDIKDLLTAELFDDFLEMAQHLFEVGYKDPAASLTGAVLESSMRKIADKSRIIVKDNDDISSLNSKLANKGVYNRLIQKQIQAWKAIRDSADHGKFNDYKRYQVEYMLERVKKFLADYL